MCAWGVVGGREAREERRGGARGARGAGGGRTRGKNSGENRGDSGIINSDNWNKKNIQSLFFNYLLFVFFAAAPFLSFVFLFLSSFPSGDVLLFFGTTVKNPSNLP